MPKIHPLDDIDGERMWEQLGKTVAVDYDGTIHPYTAGWVGPEPADEAPFPGVFDFLVSLKDAGYNVVVFSTRATEPAGRLGIRRWLKKWGLSDLVDAVTHVKPPAVAYVDDRAVSFNGDWDEVLAGVHRLAGMNHKGAAR